MLHIPIVQANILIINPKHTIYGFNFKRTGTLRKLSVLTAYLPSSFHVGENEEFLGNGSQPMLIVESKGHALHAFVNQKLQGNLCP